MITSIDISCDISEAVIYAVKFLDALNLPFFSSHKLFLKVGATMLILRNLVTTSLIVNK